MSEDEQPRSQSNVFSDGDLGSALRMMPDLPAQTLFSELMVGMYAVSIMVWDADGVIVCSNDVAARGFQMPSYNELLGKTLYEFAPEKWVHERYSVARRAIESKQRITFLEILGGFRLRTLMRPISTMVEGEQKDYVLVSVEQITSSEFKIASSTQTNEMVVFANYIELGKLDVLTSRELEVLALMGQGLRAKEIAKQLCRSVSTIDNHRDNMGEKLGVNDRGELIALAKLAALQVDDAARHRVQFSRYIKGEEGQKPE